MPTKPTCLALKKDGTSQCGLPASGLSGLSGLVCSRHHSAYTPCPGQCGFYWKPDTYCPQCHTKELEHLRDKIKMLEEQLDDSDEGEIRQALVLAQSKIQDLMQNHDTHQLRATQEESRRLQLELQSSEAELRRQLRAAQEESRRRKDEATHNTQLRAAQEEESQRLRSSEAELRRQLRAAQQESQRIQQDLQSSEEELRRQLRAAQEESQRLQLELRKDEVTHDTQQQQLRAAQEESQRLRSSEAELHRQLRTAQEESQRLQQDLQSLQEKRPGESEEELHRSLRRELDQKQEELGTLQEETRQQCRTLELQLKSLENENAYLKTVYKEELDNRMVTQYRLQTLQKEQNQSLLVNKEIPKALTYEDWFLPQIPTLLRS